jgi:hypothetical protein
VRHGEPELGEDEGPDFSWSISNGSLTYSNDRIRAYIAERVEDLKVEAENGYGISLRELVERAQTHGIAVGNLELATSTRSLSYGAETVEDITRDEELLQLAEALGAAAQVRSAVVSMSRQRSLTCNFTKLSATGVTATRFTLPELLPVALGLLCHLDESDEQSLRQLADRTRGVDDGQDTLF